MDWRVGFTNPVVTAVLGFAGGIVTSIAAHLAKTIVDTYFEARRDRIAADRKLFADLLAALPDDGNISHWRDRPVCEGYRDDQVEELDGFRLNWIGPQYQFLDGKLEKQRRLLHGRMSTFIYELSMNSFPRGDTERYGLSEHWSEEERNATARKLDALANDMISTYYQMVRLARTRLRC
jgi:hypothetical protein